VDDGPHRRDESSVSTNVALIGLGGVVVSAVVGPVWVTRISQQAKTATDQAKESIEARLGVPNGHGDMSTMLGTIIHQQAQLLDGQTGQDVRLAKIETRLSKGDERMGHLGARISHVGDQVSDVAEAQTALAERVGRIESSCTYIASHVPEEGHPG
jgi:hypothetical protein